MAFLQTSLLQQARTGGEDKRIETTARQTTLPNNVAHDEPAVLNTVVTSTTVYDRATNTIKTPLSATILVDPDNATADGVASPEGEIVFRATYIDPNGSTTVVGPWTLARREIPVTVPVACAPSGTMATASYVLSKIEVGYLGASSIKVRCIIWR